jgi:hypothetical protein
MITARDALPLDGLPGLTVAPPFGRGPDRLGLAVRPRHYKPELGALELAWSFALFGHMRDTATRTSGRRFINGEAGRTGATGRSVALPLRATLQRPQTTGERVTVAVRVAPLVNHNAIRLPLIRTQAAAYHLTPEGF